MKSMFDKIDLQEISIERTERVRSINKTEDGVFDISFNNIAHLKDGRLINSKNSLSNYIGKDVLIVDVNNGQKVLWIDSDMHKMTEFEKEFYGDCLFFLTLTLLLFYWIISIILGPANNEMFATPGIFLVCLLSSFFSFFCCLKLYSEIFSRFKAVKRVRFFRKKYKNKKEP